MKIDTPKYINAEKTIINVDITHPIHGLITYTFNSLEKDESLDSKVREYLKTAVIKPFVAPLQKDIDLELNNKIYLKIEELEKKAERPTRELLSTLTSDFDRAYAQNKINEIETAIKGFRNEIKTISST